MIGLIAAAGVSLALGLTLWRLFSGPTLYDRALAAQGVVMKTVLACAGLATMAGDARMIDIAFAILLASLVAIAAILKFFRAGSFQAAMAPSRDA